MVGGERRKGGIKKNDERVGWGRDRQGKEGERDRERKRQTETETQTETEGQRQSDRQTARQTDCKRGRQGGKRMTDRLEVGTGQGGRGIETVMKKGKAGSDGDRQTCKRYGCQR